MNFGDNERLEMSELCSALVDGTLDGAQRKRLAEMLATSEAARRFYVRVISLSASLHEYAGEMQAEAPDLPANERPATALRWTIGALAAAAAVVLAFWLGGLLKNDRGNDVATLDKDGDESVAQISGAKNCQWRGEAFQPGDELRRGQRIELVSGFAEITFDSGAQVTIEGPTALSVNSEWEAALERGTLKASVPPEAVGFHVANPAVDVLDAGTEFSVVAGSGGEREVFVTKGAVEVQSRDEAGREQPGLVLHENQARRFAVGGGTEVRDRDQKLARLAKKIPLDRLLQPANYVHWTFDELNGAMFPGLATGMERGGHDARIHAANGLDFASVRTPGRFANAAHFDGALSATSPFAGLSKRAARTVAMWVKVGEDAPLSEAGAMLSWSGAEIGWNRNPQFGALGALRTKVGRNSIAGTTPLRDGRWHHVAVVFKPGRKPDAMQIRQYVDGRLEGAPMKRGSRRVFARNSVSPGAWAGDALTIGAAQDGTFFRGDVDELFIADRVLAPQEIRQLMLRNQPVLAEPLAVN